MNRLFSFSLFALFTALACATSATAPTPVSQQPVSASSGSVLFQDDFAVQTTGWDRLLVEEGIMDYDAGGYRILVNALETNFWSTPHKNFTDVRIEVDTGRIAGPDENRIGLICRYNGSDYYFFLISSDGYYGVGIFAKGQAILLGQNQMMYSEHIKQGMAVNHLRGDCAGDTLTFYVNGIQIAQAKDSSLTSGDIGLMAGTFTTPGVDVVFDNFVVLQP